jgi:hypothetical protein
MKFGNMKRYLTQVVSKVIGKEGGMALAYRLPAGRQGRQEETQYRHL